MNEGGKVAGVRRSLPTLGPEAERELAFLMSTAATAGLDLFEVHLVDPDDLSLTRLVSSDDPDAVDDRMAPELVEQVARSGRTVVLHQSQRRDERARALWSAGHQSAVVTPLWFGQRVAGAVLAASRSYEQLPREVISGVEMIALRISGLFRREPADSREEADLEAARLDQLKRDFVHTASHELRTPLTVIRTAAQTLERKWEVLNEDTREGLLHLLVANTGTLERIFDRLLEADRAQTGLFAVRRERLDLLSLSRAVVNRLSPLLEGHQVDVVGEGPAWVAGDPVLLDRAVENLVSNAGRHTPASTVITVSVGPRGDDVELAVTDDGPGVPLDDLPSLGTAFFRGAHTTTRAPRGLGLGLTVVARILNAHGSKLEIDSITGQGATFSFRLPAAAERD